MTNSVVDNTSNLRLQPQTTANQLHQHKHKHKHQHNCNETTKMDNTIVLSGIAPDTETETGTGTNPTATTTTTTTTTTDADADAYTDAPFAVAVAVASNNSEVESQSQSQSQSESESLLLYRLPEDALCKVLSFLDARSLCDMRRLNRKFKGLASKNRAGWDHLCRDLWKDKIHVCRTARQTLESVGRHNNNSNSSSNNNNNNGESSSSTGTGTSSDGNEDSGDSESAMAAFRMSLLDVRDRYHVTREELIFDPETGKGTVWSFRFKEAAGSDWTTFDPWYNYQPCRKMVFLENGEVKIYVARQKAGEGGEQHGQPQIQPQAQAQTGTMNPGQAGTIGRSNNNNNNNNDGNSGGVGPSETGDSARQHPALPEQDPRHYRVRVPTESGANASGFDLRGPAVPMTWRFVTQPLDFPDRPVGSYVRFSLSGREVPTYVCRRSPTNNWGFVMESCWGVYASFELPPRPRGDDSSRFFRRRRRRQRRLRRALNRVQGRVDADVDAEDSSDDENDLNDDDNDDDDDDDDDNDERGEDPTGEDSLLWDDNFHVTTESQWREAFLYNNFTFAVLPDGSGALAEFQRNYGI